MLALACFSSPLFFLKSVEVLTSRVVAGTLLIVLGVCLIPVPAGW